MLQGAFASLSLSLSRTLLVKVQCSHSEVVAEVLEPCSHPKQFHGMCAECGAELTECVSLLSSSRWCDRAQSAHSNDYLGFSDLARAPVRMSHDDAELTVSLEVRVTSHRLTSSSRRYEQRTHRKRTD